MADDGVSVREKWFLDADGHSVQNVPKILMIVPCLKGHENHNFLRVYNLIQTETGKRIKPCRPIATQLKSTRRMQHLAAGGGKRACVSRAALCRRRHLGEKIWKSVICPLLAN